MKSIFRASSIFALTLLMCLTIVFISNSYAATGDEIELRVMTINLRHNSDFWEERFPLIADEIVRLSPDIIGLQEVEIGVGQSTVLLNLIKEKSGGELKYYYYEQLKTGMEMMSGEGIAIFSKLPLKKQKHADLENGRPVVFSRIEIADGFAVDMFNTHLHHRGGDEVRLPQAQKITSIMKKINSGNLTFLTGDMNALRDSGTIAHYIDSGFVDTYLAVHGQDAEGFTSPVELGLDNPAQNFKKTIDYVFAKIPEQLKDSVKIVDSVVCFKNHDDRGLYPSDHLGVMTTLSVKLP